MLSPGSLNYHKLTSDFLWNGASTPVLFKSSASTSPLSLPCPEAAHTAFIYCVPLPGLELAASELRGLCKISVRLTLKDSSQRDSNASLLRSEIAVVSNTTSTVTTAEPVSDHCDVRITYVSVSILFLSSASWSVCYL